MKRPTQDFAWSWRGFTVKETGAYYPYKIVIGDAWKITQYAAAEHIRRFGKKQKYTISSAPAPLKPWYLMWGIIKRSGGTFKKPGSAADIAVYFEDQTNVSPSEKPDAALHINYDCVDISKARVAKTFEEVFGYGLEVDPETYSGQMVCKSNLNGAHDGEVLSGPVKARSGQVYQKLIDNTTENGTVQDFRTPTLQGQALLVYIKERPQAQRFANLNTKCRVSEPQKHFTPDELAKISQFCQKMKLDFGGLDILRDSKDNRIYIVDVNKTDMGPPLILPLKEKLRSTDILAEAFTAAIDAKKG